MQPITSTNPPIIMIIPVVFLPRFGTSNSWMFSSTASVVSFSVTLTRFCTTIGC